MEKRKIDVVREENKIISYCGNDIKADTWEVVLPLINYFNYA